MNNTSDLIALGRTPVYRPCNNLSRSYSSPGRKYTPDKDVSELSSIHYSVSTVGKYYL